MNLVDTLLKLAAQDVNAHHGTCAELIKARDEATSRNTKRRG